MDDLNEQCDGCAYRRMVEQDHVCCMYNWEKSLFHNRMPRGSARGMIHGWFVFPNNFDPEYMIDICQARAEKADPKMVREIKPVPGSVLDIGAAEKGEA